MKIMFWNTHKNCDINKYIDSLIFDNSVDVAVLDEYKDEEEELLKLVRANKKEYKKYITTGCDRIKIFSCLKEVEPATQDKYYSLQIINNEIILCGTHLPSDLHGNMSYERQMIIRTIMNDIKDIEKELCSDKTIIVGDLNEMPYHNGCMDADCFHGMSYFCRGQKTTREVLGEEYRKYYNPMWNYFGDFNGPPGTYYYNKSTLYSPMWYMYDQFILGSELAEKVDYDKISIITSCSVGSLLKPSGIPNDKISDHFPILCDIEV